MLHCIDSFAVEVLAKRGLRFCSFEAGTKGGSSLENSERF